MKKIVAVFFLAISACTSSTVKKEQKTPVVGFLDLLQDETLAEARKGFFVALNDSGYKEENQTMHVIYRNAQNDQPTLLQACDYILSQNPDLIATCPTVATITAVRRNAKVPVFMMVSPRPDLAKLTNEFGRAPRNLFGIY